MWLPPSGQRHVLAPQWAVCNRFEWDWRDQREKKKKSSSYNRTLKSTLDKGRINDAIHNGERNLNSLIIASFIEAMKFYFLSTDWRGFWALVIMYILMLTYQMCAVWEGEGEGGLWRMLFFVLVLNVTKENIIVKTLVEAFYLTDPGMFHKKLWPSLTV